MLSWAQVAAGVPTFRRVLGAAEADTSSSMIRVDAWVSAGPQPTPGPAPAARAPSGRREEPCEQARTESAAAQASGERKASVISCPLCLEDATVLTTTLCGHVFCKEVRFFLLLRWRYVRCFLTGVFFALFVQCITAAIRHKPECPVCRTFVHVRSLHPIYLNIIT